MRTTRAPACKVPKGIGARVWLQVVSYGIGDFYAEHYDNKVGGAVTRAATIIIYLTDTPAGGATFFPK